MILITATGRDQPGMVAAISQKLFEARCNVEDTTMTRLSGEFAMMLVVAPPEGLSAHTLSQQLSELHLSHGLHIHCTAFDESATSSTPMGSEEKYLLSVYGPDRTGLVARVAGVLAEHRVNITDLQTRVAGGHQLYVMIFELELPAQLDLHPLTAELDSVAAELGLEYSLHPIEEDAL